MAAAPESEDTNLRSVRLEWDDDQFTATNVRGGTLQVGTGDSESFTPVELLLTALGGCAGLDMRIMLARRQEPSVFNVAVAGTKTRDELGNYIKDMKVTFEISLTDDDGGVARDAVQPLMERTHERICIVSKTLELPSEIDFSAQVTESRASE